jgi:hypothetical protein
MAFLEPSPRAALPPGKLEGCTVRARVRISSGALLQMGMDSWRSPTIPYGSGGNNHEAGASNWYFPSPEWQKFRLPMSAVRNSRSSAMEAGRPHPSSITQSLLE